MRVKNIQASLYRMETNAAANSHSTGIFPKRILARYVDSNDGGMPFQVASIKLGTLCLQTSAQFDSFTGMTKHLELSLDCYALTNKKNVYEEGIWIQF